MYIPGQPDRAGGLLTSTEPERYQDENVICKGVYAIFTKRKPGVEKGFSWRDARFANGMLSGTPRY